MNPLLLMMSVLHDDQVRGCLTVFNAYFPACSDLLFIDEFQTGALFDVQTGAFACHCAVKGEVIGGGPVIFSVR